MATTKSPSTWLDALDGATVRRMATANTAAMVLGFVPMVRWERRMRATGGPGIMGLQLARDTTAAEEVLEKWGPAGRQAATEQTWADFPWMLTYGLAGVCVAESPRRRATPDSGWDRIGSAARWGPAAAVACDVIEGVGLLRTLGAWPHTEGRVVRATCVAATTKYALLLGTAAWATGASLGARRRS